MHAHESISHSTRNPLSISRGRLFLRHSAFTLIELICVVIIIAVLAALTVPRMINTRARAAENESRAVQRLLSVASEKSGLWSLPVAVDYSGGRLSVWTRRTDGSDSIGVAGTRWAPDPLVEPVMLTNTQIREATADGVILSRSKWRVEFAPGQPRPVLAIALELSAAGGGNGTKAGWDVRLDPESPGVSRIATGGGGDARPPVNMTRSIDLDDAGKGTAPW